jgi:TolB-like protein/Tfp pilus assembly protein PilF
MTNPNLDSPTLSTTTPSTAESAVLSTRPVSGLRDKLSHVKGAVIAVASLGAVLSGLAGYYTTYKTVADTATPPSTAAPKVDTINSLSILVLPFANQTGDANKAYIADALTSSISADLNRIRDAFVVPTATAFSYKDKNLTVAQAGKEAGVRFVLQGGVVANGDKLRINVQLADTQSGKQLWNETFEGKATNMFELQDLVTARIGNSIGNELVIVAARESEKRKSSTKVADLMMRQRALGLKAQSTETFNQREALLRAVIQQAPDDAEALGELARILAVYAFNFLDKSSPRSQAMFTEAKVLALRAKAIDDQLPGIYTALAFYESHIEKDRAEERRNYEMALKLAPKNPVSYSNLAIWYTFDVQPKMAIELLNKALALYPKGSGLVFLGLSRSYLMLGDNTNAIQWGQRAIDVGTQLPFVYEYLARASGNLGQTEKAALYVNEYQHRMVQLGRKNGLYRLDGSESPAWVKYYNEHYLPEWRKAMLPE